VVVPAGQWLTGAIHLKSNVNLHMLEGAEIHFSDDPADYLPVVFTRWAGFEVINYSPLIYAHGCENIAITGPGRL
jgi:polygalacturonase